VFCNQLVLHSQVSQEAGVRILILRCPAGANTGDLLQVQDPRDGQILQVVVPEGTPIGAIFRVEVPSSFQVGVPEGLPTGAISGVGVSGVPTGAISGVDTPEASTPITVVGVPVQGRSAVNARGLVGVPIQENTPITSQVHVGVPVHEPSPSV